MQREAEFKFRKEGIRNADIRTFHSLAYSYLPKHLRKLSKVSNLRLSLIKPFVEELKIEKRIPLTQTEIWQLTSYVYYHIKNNRLHKNRVRFKLEQAGYKLSDIEAWAEEIHKKIREKEIIDYDDMLHLLLEKLKGKSRIKKNKVVIVDEAQDINEIQLEIARELTSEGGKLLLVGDPHQNIYSWRGAYNQLLTIEDKLYLNYSYRFPGGSLIEELANVILKLKGEQIPIVGKGKQKGVGTKAYISRTNAELIEKAIELASENIPFEFIRPPEEVMNLPLDIYRRFVRRQPPLKEFWLMNFASLADLKDYAEKAEDIEVESALALLETYRNPEKILDLIEMYNTAGAPIKLATAHSSKGLEFDMVEMLDDFPNLHDWMLQKWSDWNQVMWEYRMGLQDAVEFIEELNLQYVAITRARQQLYLYPAWLEDYRVNNF